jgi:hypothetical protein
LFFQRPSYGRPTCAGIYFQCVIRHSKKPPKANLIIRALPPLVATSFSPWRGSLLLLAGIGFSLEGDSRRVPAAADRTSACPRIASPRERRIYVLARCKLKPLTLIKILRPLLPGYRMQAHLTECAAYEVIDRLLAPYLPPLRKRHVLGIERLPRRNEGAHVFLHPTLKQRPAPSVGA